MASGSASVICEKTGRIHAMNFPRRLGISALAFLSTLFVMLTLALPVSATEGEPFRDCGSWMDDWSGTSFTGYTGYNSGYYGGEYSIAFHLYYAPRPNYAYYSYQTFKNPVDGTIRREGIRDATAYKGPDGRWRVKSVISSSIESGKTTVVEISDPICAPNSSRVISAEASLPYNFSASIRRDLGVCGSHIEDYVGQNYVGIQTRPDGSSRSFDAKFTEDGTAHLTLGGVTTSVPVVVGTQAIASGNQYPGDPYREVARLDWVAWDAQYITVKGLCPTGWTRPTRLDGILYGTGETFELLAGDPAGS